MDNEFSAAMRRATDAAQAQDPREATRIIQDALHGRRESGAAASKDVTPSLPVQRLLSRKVDADGEIRMPDAGAAPQPSPASPGAGAQPNGTRLPRLRELFGKIGRGRHKVLQTVDPFASLPGVQVPARRSKAPPIPDAAQFLTRSFACPAGARQYKLYIPASAKERPRGLIVMLHGCKQDADDFAAGTQANAVAEEHRLLVAYPCQSPAANSSSCWNWFEPADQARGQGEPQIIAGITQEIMTEFGLKRDRVFVAGLSAGGAMAAVMAETYPDLYAAAGIHSGLAYRSANDVMSAFAAMGGKNGHMPRRAASSAMGDRPKVRTIIFQGRDDRTVHPSNADAILDAAHRNAPSAKVRQEQGESKCGRGFTRTFVTEPDGTAAIEYWLVDAAGHAWSGGHRSGSFTDPKGPDASAEMVRFFLAGKP